MAYKPRIIRNSDGSFDWDMFTIFSIIAIVVIGIVIVVYVGISHEISSSKLPPILHRITQIENDIKVKVWRKDYNYLNDAIIVIDDNKVMVKSRGDTLTIPIEEAKVLSYNIDPIRRVSGGFFDSVLTDNINQYVISLKIERIE